MGLRMKFNLALMLTTVAGLLVSGMMGYRFLQNNAREEVLQMARVMMDSAIAVRGYTVGEIKPLLAVQQKRQFISQTVPAYAASQYVKNLQKAHPEYSYREATLNPTNPANRPAEWESDLINYFRNREDAPEMTGERVTPAGPSMYLSRPIRITNPKCLTCHGKPSEAPKTLIDAYGSANGFGWKVGEVVGAQIVSVPMSVPLARADSAFFAFMSALLVVFIFIGLMLNVLLNIIVVSPIRRVSAKADQVSMGDLAVDELELSGNDEITSLSRSFNRMHRSLNNAMSMLDDEDE